MNTVSLSADLVAYLRDSRGMSLRQIGELVDLSESYVSRVANGQRRFTLEHLDRFEKALGQPLPLLLLEACWKPKAPSGEQAMFDEALALLRRSASLSATAEAKCDRRTVSWTGRPAARLRIGSDSACGRLSMRPAYQSRKPASIMGP